MWCKNYNFFKSLNVRDLKCELSISHSKIHPRPRNTYYLPAPGLCQNLGAIMNRGFWDTVKIFTRYFQLFWWTLQYKYCALTLIWMGFLGVRFGVFGVWWRGEWELRQDQVNLLVYRTYRPYFKQKQKSNIAKFSPTGFF